MQPQSEEEARHRQEEARRRQSLHANLAGQKPPDDFELLISSREAAKLLGISARTLWGLQKSGAIVPVRIGRLVRWNRDQLKAWVNAGCPRHGKRGQPSEDS
jgi:excisionase family DNA binding protein